MSAFEDFAALAAEVRSYWLGRLADKWSQGVHAAEVRMVHLALWAGAALLSGGLAVALGVALVVWLSPPGGRVTVLAAAAGLSAAACIAIAIGLRHTLRRPATHPNGAGAATALRRILRDLRRRQPAP